METLKQTPSGGKEAIRSRNTRMYTSLLVWPLSARLFYRAQSTLPRHDVPRHHFVRNRPKVHCGIRFNHLLSFLVPFSFEVRGNSPSSSRSLFSENGSLIMTHFSTITHDHFHIFQKSFVRLSPPRKIKGGNTEKKRHKPRRGKSERKIAASADASTSFTDPICWQRQTWLC